MFISSFVMSVLVIILSTQVNTCVQHVLISLHRVYLSLRCVTSLQQVFLTTMSLFIYPCNWYLSLSNVLKDIPLLNFISYLCVPVPVSVYVPLSLCMSTCICVLILISVYVYLFLCIYKYLYVLEAIFLCVRKSLYMCTYLCLLDI